MLVSATASWNALGEISERMTSSANNRGGFLRECRNGDFDGVIAICDRAPRSLAITGKYDQELLEALPESLRFICHNGQCFLVHYVQALGFTVPLIHA